ncbi:MAG: O-antigen ligase family protein [Rhizobiaceae bacterium]
MNSSQIDHPPLSNSDYWVLRCSRDSAAQLLFVISLILQIALTRWLPLAIGIALLIVLTGHALTRFRHSEMPFALNASSRNTWPPKTSILLFSYAAFVFWMAVSLSWSPLPLDGIRDVALLVAAPPLAILLARELSKTIFLSVSNLLAIGVLFASALLILELGGFTELHKLGSPRNGIHDLNRNVVLLALFIPVLLLIPTANPIRFAAAALGICASIIAISLSISESAKLMLVVVVIVWVTIRLVPKLYMGVYLAMSATILIFPLLLPPISKITTPLHAVNQAIKTTKQDQTRAKLSLEMLKRQQARDDRLLKKNEPNPTSRGKVLTSFENRKSKLIQARQELKRAISAHNKALQSKLRIPFNTRSATARVPIWMAYRNLATERPIFGHGIRANRHYGGAGAAKRPDMTHSHPHNFAMELWVDLGAVGVGLFAIVLIMFGFATSNLAPRNLAVVGAVVAAGFSHSMTGAGFLQGWWVASLSLVAIALLVILEYAPPKKES